MPINVFTHTPLQQYPLTFDTKKVDPKSRIDFLVKKLNEANDAYYHTTKPIMSDQAYDKLYRELEELEKQHPDLIKLESPTGNIGYKLPPKVIDPNKVPHMEQMYSLRNAYHIEDVYRHIDRVLNADAFRGMCVEPKYDGLALEVVYCKKNPVKVSTRGDGSVGELLPYAIPRMNLPKLKYTQKDMMKFIDPVIYGECIITHDELKRVNEIRLERGEIPYANCRNAVAGLIRTEEDYDVELKFIPYRVFMGGMQSVAMEVLETMGFDPIERHVVTDNYHERITDIIKHYTERRPSLNYDIDGVVIKLDCQDEEYRLGYTAKYPNGSIAYKFPAEQAMTRLTDIIVQRAPSGRLTPVGILEPVKLDGVVITRVTLNNFKYIEEMDVRIGDYVNIIRAGGVIPKLTSVYREVRSDDIIRYAAPSQCPYCSFPNKMEGKYMYCSNPDCKDQ